MGTFFPWHIVALLVVAGAVWFGLIPAIDYALARMFPAAAAKPDTRSRILLALLVATFVLEYVGVIDGYIIDSLAAVLLVVTVLSFAGYPRAKG